MLSTAFIVLLIGVLVAAVISFALMGRMQARRSRALSEEANKLGMGFSADDPFDVPRRYGGFILIGGGHSARASNMIHGRLSGRPVRSFDFRYEVGHGPRRMARHYSVVVVETERPLPPILMWNDRDAEAAPLQARCSDGHVACWAYRGEARQAARLADLCAELADDGTGLQTWGARLMVFAPVRRSAGGCSRLLAQTVRMAEALDPRLDQSPAT